MTALSAVSGYNYKMLLLFQAVLNPAGAAQKKMKHHMQKDMGRKAAIRENKMKGNKPKGKRTLARDMAILQ